ncbi:hypothetical protein [Kitasatospora viridis]|uniref:Uncharacterized protein n=1 Tax=Kitasatospora viridis TaxID=281105 RepID=A0A561SA15_9ACTN|nr:hypothetical protein [Kitasatospora viridis]TWF71716.1 hypothetical protein FHX73_1887 [Kitasatospora viridis]
MNPKTANAAATFLPADPAEPGTLPCIEIGGAQVYAYLDDDGTLCVSVNLETAAPGLVRADDTVPLRITVGDREVFTG